LYLGLRRHLGERCILSSREGRVQDDACWMFRNEFLGRINQSRVQEYQ
jgi:hypothetical protein